MDSHSPVSVSIAEALHVRSDVIRFSFYNLEALEVAQTYIYAWPSSSPSANMTNLPVCPTAGRSHRFLVRIVEIGSCYCGTVRCRRIFCCEACVTINFLVCIRRGWERKEKKINEVVKERWLEQAVTVNWKQRCSFDSTFKNLKEFLIFSLKFPSRPLPKGVEIDFSRSTLTCTGSCADPNWARSWTTSAWRKLSAAAFQVVSWLACQD